MAVSKQRMLKVEQQLNPHQGRTLSTYFLLTPEDKLEYDNNAPALQKDETRFVIDLSEKNALKAEEKNAPKSTHVVNPITHEVRLTIGAEPESAPTYNEFDEDEVKLKKVLEAQCLEKINSNIVSYGLYGVRTAYTSISGLYQNREATDAFTELLASKMKELEFRANHIKMVRSQPQ